MKNRTTAAILAICLGGLGIHRFYLNQPLLGVLYLLFCWTFIPLFVSIIDFIWLLVMDDDTFDDKFNYDSSSTYTYTPSPPIAQNQNVTINNGAQSVDTIRISEEIEKFHELKEKGIITEEEFELKKKSLLGQ